MIRVSVLYPEQDGSRFDMDYYTERHMGMVRERFAPHGLQGIQVERGLSGGRPGSPPAYRCIATLTFETMEHYKAAFKEHGAALMEDVPNFTDITPQIQVGEVVL